jgi:hypothetical protein
MKMIKDKVSTVRVNSDVQKLLEKNGWTIQQLLDWAIDQKIQVETKLKVKK